jgi:hypothetical protein
MFIQFAVLKFFSHLLPFVRRVLKWQGAGSSDHEPSLGPSGRPHFCALTVGVLVLKMCITKVRDFQITKKTLLRNSICIKSCERIVLLDIIHRLVSQEQTKLRN